VKSNILIAALLLSACSQASESAETQAAEESAAAEAGAGKVATAEKPAETTAGAQAGDLAAHLGHTDPEKCEEGPDLTGARMALAFQPDTDPTQFFAEPVRAAMSDFRRDSMGAEGEVASVQIDRVWNGLRLVAINWYGSGQRWEQAQFIFADPAERVAARLRDAGYPARANETVTGKLIESSGVYPMISVDDDAMGEDLTYFSCERMRAG